MVGAYVDTVDTSTCRGISRPVAQKLAFTNNRRKSALWRSTDAPMVVANAFPGFPPGSWYVRVQAMGNISFSVLMGASAVMPLVDCPYSNTVASSNAPTVYTSVGPQLSVTPVSTGCVAWASLTTARVPSLPWPPWWLTHVSPRTTLPKPFSHPG